MKFAASWKKSYAVKGGAMTGKASTLIAGDTLHGIFTYSLFVKNYVKLLM
jgi:hypothetical protein